MRPSAASGGGNGKVRLSLSRHLAVALAGVLVVAEVSARLYGFGDPPLVALDQEIEYYPVPNRSYRRFGQRIEINSMGMRGPQVDPARIDRSRSFAMFGDSIVFGYGLDQSDTVPMRLQEILRRQHSASDATVMNVAASSWGPENILAFYRRFGPFRGNVAWIVQSTHDMVDVMHQPNDPPPYKSQPTYFALQDLGLSLWRRISTRLGLGGSDGQTFEAKRERSDRALAELIEKLKADYSRVVLVFHANRAESAREATAGPAHFQRMAQLHGIEFLSTIEPYTQAAAAGRKPHFDDIHLSASGAELLADLLARSPASSSQPREGTLR